VYIEKERLDRIIHLVYPSLSRKIIKLWFEKNNIKVNGLIVKAGRYVYRGDIIGITDITPILGYQWINLDHDAPQFNILYDNDNLLFLDKPPDLATHPLHPWDTKSAVCLVLARYPELQDIGHHQSPGLLHRLDNETSGVLVFAKRSSVYQKMREALQQRQWEKEYICWVDGQITKSQIINYMIAHHPVDTRQMVIVKHTQHYRGKPQLAITQLTPITIEKQRWTALHVKIITGVRHQIRLHLSSIGCPIVGDQLYGYVGNKSEFNQMCRSIRHREHSQLRWDWQNRTILLHSWQVKLPSIPEQSEVIICSPPPFPFPTFSKMTVSIK
jgi:23S rRNA pseudouridine1911/1915/1917 synthase